MENNNHKKRKVMLIAAFAVAVIALAGVGYAAVAGYKGTTVITDNDAEGKLIVVTDHDAAYTGTFGTATVGEVPINTYTDISYKGNDTLYTLKNSTEITTGVYGAQVGGTLTLDIKGNTTAKYNLTINLVGTLNASANWTYYVKVDNSFTEVSGNTANVTIIGETPDENQDIEVSLYITSTTLFEDPTAFPDKAIGTGNVDDYTGKATAKGSPVNASGFFFENLSAVFTFETVASS